MIHPLNLKVKTILKVAISLAFVAFVLLLWTTARPVPIHARVTFTAFTNLATPFPITQASFCVSNAGRCSVFEESEYYFIDIKNKPHDSLFGFVGRVELKPGEFKTSSRFPPTEIKRERHLRVDDRGSLVLQTNLEPWRLSLMFSKADWRGKLVRNPSWVLQKALRLVPAKWLERHPIEVHSDWINGPELMPVATNTGTTRPK